MTNDGGKPVAGLLGEVRNIVRHGRTVWTMVPRRYKRRLRAASAVMAVVSLSGALIPLLVGGLVDAMRGKVPPDWASAFPLYVAGEAAEVASLGAAEPSGGIGDAVRLPPDLLLRIALTYLAVVALAFLLREGLRVLHRYLVQDTMTRVEKETAVSLVGHLLKVDLGTLTHERIGALHGRIHRSIEGYVRFLKIAFLDFWPAVMAAAFALGAAVTKAPLMGLVMLGVVPVSMAITARQLLSQKGIRIQLLRSKEGLDATVVEQLGGIEFIRAANTHDLEAKRVEAAAEERRARAVRHHVAMAGFDAAKAINEGFFHILVISLSIYLAATGRISVGDIFALSSLFLQVTNPLREIHRIIDEGHESSIQVEDLLDMLNQPVDHSFHLPTIRRPAAVGGRPVIHTENLVVEYRARDGKLKRALDGVSLTVRHGESVGLVGRSGCGKTTLLKVVMRLIHPTGGTVLVCGEPIDAVSREVIGEMFGYVSQTPFVFAGTVEENIAYGNPHATPAAVREAAERAFIHDEIMAMPAGYQTPLAERGLNLSGGQRQRIALARVFLKNPPILILDEGTSALDNISERHVQRAIAAARADRTVLTVAHRLTTLRDADRIFVFESGRVVEVGTYDELIGNSGVFSELVRSGEGGVPAGV